MTNRLAGQSSPYLLQHAGNPVDWYPWGEEAFTRAAAEDKPIFLSIGYSACHWCHVMERESFADAATAALMNEHFVSIKVDREERPDLDAIYMRAVTALAGNGGWPLSVWLDLDGAPFYGGTYFPPSPQYGRPSFRQVLVALADIWCNRRDELSSTTERIRAHLAEDEAERRPTPRATLLEQADERLAASFDPVHGGWDSPPKFPQPLVLEYLLARQIFAPSSRVGTPTLTTLDRMASGGVYDHVGGGFHRYSTDRSWSVPHFEKMLYDNAQLAHCYLHAWQVTQEPRYREVTEDTLDYLLSRMSNGEGGFFSAEDADSAGREGAFYLWTPAELRAVLGESEADLVARVYGIEAEGDFEGASILHLNAPHGQRESPSPADTTPAEEVVLRAALGKLEKARDRRERPFRDEKVVTAWNGLALATLSDAARALDSSRYLEAAAQTGAFIRSRMIHSGDRLAHSWKDGRAHGNGFLDDYASVADGMLALYQATFDEQWFGLARALVDSFIGRFHREEGGFYDTSDDHETLIVRPRSLQDSPTPCGNSSAATVLLKLAAFTGEDCYRRLAEETLASAPAYLAQAPTLCGQWLVALQLAETGLTEVALVGPLEDPRTAVLRAVLDGTFHPALVAAARPPGTGSTIPLLASRESLPIGGTLAWVCRDFVCSAPTSDAEELASLLAYE